MLIYIGHTIKLTQGKYAIVDERDYDWLSQKRWYAWWSGGHWYVRRCGDNGTKIFMHRQILNAQKGEVIDHINNNGLDNRRKNIRKCTWQQNAMNMKPHKDSSSKYKGVFWHKKGKKWSAQIRVNGHRNHLGLFVKEIDAAIAYDNAAKENYGEYAWLNFKNENFWIHT